jgi:hypothetical protein
LHNTAVGNSTSWLTSSTSSSSKTAFDEIVSAASLIEKIFFFFFLPDQPKHSCFVKYFYNRQRGYMTGFEVNVWSPVVLLEDFIEPPARENLILYRRTSQLLFLPVLQI